MRCLPRAAAAVVVGMGLGWMSAGCGGPSAADAPATPTAAPAVTVTVAPVAVRGVDRVVSVVGTLAANAEADLAAELEGQVIVIEADLGDRVTAGQSLAKVRSDTLAARLREAEASLEKAAAEESRARPLRGEGIISVQEYEQIRTAHEVARARRDQLRIEIDRASVRSPFSGSIAARTVDVGDYVRPGTVVFRIVQDDPLKFRGDVPERDAPLVVAGLPMRVQVEAYRGETFDGTVSRVGAVSDPTVRAVAFEALVPNGDHRIRPGFFGRGEVVVSHDDRALAVPRGAVAVLAGVTKVFVIEDGVARERQVTLGVELGDGWVEVLQGVSRGGVVATSGLSKLVDGTAVSVRTDVVPGA